MNTTNTNAQPPAPGATARARHASLGGAVVAALAASACCLGPALLAFAGLSGVGFAAALEPYRPILLGATVALLGLGFWLTYRKPRALADGSAASAASASGEACGVDGCEMQGASRAGRISLWAVTALVVLVASYPYVAGAFATKAADGAVAAARTTTTVRIQVEGMDCPACTTQIVRDLVRLDGVVRAEVNYEHGFASVTYDPARVQPARFVEVIDALGYNARQGR